MILQMTISFEFLSFLHRWQKSFWGNGNSFKPQLELHPQEQPVCLLEKQNKNQHKTKQKTPKTYFVYVYTCLCVNYMPQCKYSPRT